MSLENKLFGFFNKPNGKNYLRYSPTSTSTVQMTGYATSSNSQNPYHRVTEASVLAPIQTRIAIDASQNLIRHVRVDSTERFQELIDDSLNDIFNYRANIDQTGTDLLKDFFLTMQKVGIAVLVPVEYDGYMFYENGISNIREARVGTIEEWFYREVRVRLFNPESGAYESVIVPKANVVIVTNPMYPVMNEGNSQLNRLCRKMGQLDSIDDRTSSGKLEMLIKLPFVAKGSKKVREATDRIDIMQRQLNGTNEYGIGYIDATEDVIQLNRPIDNGIFAQTEAIKNEAYSQLGMTKEVFEGTASEEVMKNYYSRTIQPILKAFTDELSRKWIPKEKYKKDGERFKFFIDAFSYASVSTIADVADKFVTAEILSPNDMRSIIGFPPSDSAASDELRNRHINQGTAQAQQTPMAPSDGAASEEMPTEEKEA